MRHTARASVVGVLGGRRFLAAAVTSAFFILTAASAEACLTLPATMKWEGETTEFAFGGYRGLWTANVTDKEISPGVWRSEGPGTVRQPNGSGPGHVEDTLTCTSPTTFSMTNGQWTDSLGDNVGVQGNLSIGSNTALESGTWQGTIWGGPLGFVSDNGTFEGALAAQAPSGGIVTGTVEVESTPGTLVNSLQTEVATKLPLLPSPEDIAPVGGVSFAANLPAGATITIKLVLPRGSHPTHLFKLVNGSYVEVPATISGETVEFQITDGGTFDEDHSVNGEVVDPVIPVSSGLQVRSGELPEATRGVVYHAQLVASGGTQPYKWKKVGKLPKGLKAHQGRRHRRHSEHQEAGTRLVPDRSRVGRCREAEADRDRRTHPAHKLSGRRRCGRRVRTAALRSAPLASELLLPRKACRACRGRVCRGQ